MLIKTDSTQAPIKERDLVERTRHESQAAELAHELREATPLMPDAAGMDVTSHEQRAGRPMSAITIQQKLQKIAPFLVFERSNADKSKTGIYIRSNVRGIDLYKGDLIYVCGMESGISPEFSIIEAEAKAVPDATRESGERLQFGMAREIRGWRTLLARLLKWRIISAHDVEKHFHVSLGRDSSRWQELLMGRMEYFSQETEKVHVGTNREEKQSGSPDAGGPAGSNPGTESPVSEGTGEGGGGAAEGSGPPQADDRIGDGGNESQGQSAAGLRSR